MTETFKLPASSYEELIKLIQAYANPKEGVSVSLNVISQTTGMHSTKVSKNNGFLVQSGLINEGKQKAATETGRSLGRAYGTKMNDEIERIWKEIIADNDFLNRMISAVRIRNGMERSNFINHIIYSSGQKDNNESRAGAGAIIEILKTINVLNETDGKLTVVEETDKEKTNNVQVRASESQPTKGTCQEDRGITNLTSSPVTISININCSVGEVDELTEKLKKLLGELSKS